MTRMIRLAAIVALAAVTLPAGVRSQETDTAAAGTLTGSWLVTIESPQGAFETTWDLEQAEDGSLSGITKSEMTGDTPFEGGWVDGDAFGFAVTIDMQGQSFDVSYEGTFTEDELAGVLDVGGGQFTTDFTGVRADGGDR